MFRQFFDTSFNDHRQVRVVVQELFGEKPITASPDFQRFSTSLFNHKSYTFEQFKIDYCFVKEKLVTDEAPLNEIQLYRRPFAFIFFAVVRSTDELQRRLDAFRSIQQQHKDAFVHLFVRYRTVDTTDDETLSTDGKLDNTIAEEADYPPSYRQSVSSMISVDSYSSLPQLLSAAKQQESLALESSGNAQSDPSSLTNSMTGSLSFQGTAGSDALEPDEMEPSASVEITTQSSKKTKKPLFKSFTLTTPTIRDSFDIDVTRASHNLETNLSKLAAESKDTNETMFAVNSQLADVRLTIQSEQNCSLLEMNQTPGQGYNHDKTFKFVLSEFDMRVLLILLNQYSRASTILGTEAARDKVPKKTVEARTSKRKADCYLLLGAVEKAESAYRRAVELLKTQNDAIWHAAALEGRVAVTCSSTQKPKTRFPKTMSYLSQRSLTRMMSLKKIFKLSSHVLLHSQPDIEQAVRIYRGANSSLYNKQVFRLELDACLRWCSLLCEQSDLRKYRNDIDEYVKRINELGYDLTEHMDSIYLNAYLAETYGTIGWKRKSALYYRSAAYAGLMLLNGEKGYDDEVDFFDELIKRARTGYGVDDNQLIFPLIQKTIISESIQISLKNNDFTTIIENVHFAIETLIEHMIDEELKQLLTFLNGSDQSIACSYCSIPRLKSLDILSLPDRLKPVKTDADRALFIYRPKVVASTQQQSIHRKVDFFWVKNESAQVALVVENYLPSTMYITQLQLITDNELQTDLETKYRIPARTNKRLLIDCTPKQTGPCRIQGLRYRILSTNQEYLFKDVPAIRHCACSVDIIDELPILDVQSLLVNGNPVTQIEKSPTYTAQAHREEELFVTFTLVNRSLTCDVDFLEVQVFNSGFNMTECIKVTQLDLPLTPGQTIRPVVDLSELYSRCLQRQGRAVSNFEFLTVEFRLKYTNEASKTNGYRRQSIAELRLDYFSSINFEINDIQNDEDDLSYLICCTVVNQLSESITFDDTVIKPTESSLLTLKQPKIQLQPLPSDLNQLIAAIRNQLPTHIHYKTTNSNKPLRLPIDWSSFSDEKIQTHFNALIQSPYTCDWRFDRRANTLHIHLCVSSKQNHISQMEFRFPSTTGIRFLNSNRIVFNDIEPGKFVMAERVLTFSQADSTDVLVVDVSVNNIAWKRITLTF